MNAIIIYENIKKIVRIRNNPSSAAEKNLLYIQEIGMLPSEQASSVCYNKFNSYMILLIHDGEGIIEYDGLEYSVKKGQCVFIDCSREHYYKCCSDNPWAVSWFNFNGFSAKFYFSEFTKKNRFIFTPSSFEVIEKIFKEMLSLNSYRSEQKEILNNKYITDILSIFITEFCVGEEKNITSKVKSIKSYIDLHFTEDITLDSLAEFFFINKFYISREFKKYYKITVFQYIMDKRMQLAKKLLIQTKKSIEEIAIESGFHGQNYFSIRFKMYEGISCLAYRKKHKVS